MFFHCFVVSSTRCDLFEISLFQTPSMKAVVDACAAVVSIFSRSHHWTEALSKVQLDRDSKATPVTLVQTVETRWYSTADMVCRVSELYGHIMSVFDQFIRKPPVKTKKARVDEWRAARQALIAAAPMLCVATRLLDICRTASLDCESHEGSVSSMMKVAATLERLMKVSRHLQVDAGVNHVWVCRAVLQTEPSVLLEHFKNSCPVKDTWPTSARVEHDHLALIAAFQVAVSSGLGNTETRSCTLQELLAQPTLRIACRLDHNTSSLRFLDLAEQQKWKMDFEGTDAAIVNAAVEFGRCLGCHAVCFALQ